MLPVVTYQLEGFLVGGFALSEGCKAHTFQLNLAMMSYCETPV